MFWKIKLRSYFILFSNDNNKIQFVGELLIDLIEYKKHTSVKIVFWPLCRVQIAQSMAQKWAAPWEKNSTDISAISVLFCISDISKTSTIMPCRIGGSLPCFTQLHIQRERERERERERCCLMIFSSNTASSRWKSFTAKMQWLAIQSLASDHCLGCLCPHSLPPAWCLLLHYTATLHCTCTLYSALCTYINILIHTLHSTVHTHALVCNTLGKHQNK